MSVRRYPLRRLVPCVVLAAAAALTLSAIARGANGVITGKLAKTPAGKLYEPTVRVYRLAPNFDDIKVVVAPNGRFAVRARPGLYAVAQTGWARGKLRRLVKLVTVRSARVAAVATVKATPAPAKIRVSVGTIAVTDPTAPAAWGEGVQSLALADSAGIAPPGCGSFSTVVDRTQDPVFKEIIKELKLQTTRFFPAATQASARQALKNLPKYAPTHRVNGTIDRVSATSSSGTFRVTDMRTGKVIAQQRFELTGDNAAADLPGVAVKAMHELICNPNPPKLRVQVSGSFASQDIQASATLQASAEYEVVQRAGEPGNYDLVAPVTWTLGAVTVTDFPGSCVVSGGTPMQLIPMTGATVVLRDGTATAFLFPILGVSYVEAEPAPPIGCNGFGQVAVSAGAAPGITAKGPLGAAIPVSGGNGLGTFNVTVTVSPVT